MGISITAGETRAVTEALKYASTKLNLGMPTKLRDPTKNPGLGRGNNHSTQFDSSLVEFAVWFYVVYQDAYNSRYWAYNQFIKMHTDMYLSEIHKKTA